MEAKSPAGALLTKERRSRWYFRLRESNFVDKKFPGNGAHPTTPRLRRGQRRGRRVYAENAEEKRSLILGFFRLFEQEFFVKSLSPD